MIKGAVDLHLSAGPALDKRLDSSDLDLRHCEIFLESDVGPEVVALDDNGVPMVRTSLEFTGTDKRLITTVEGKFQTPAQATSVHATTFRLPAPDGSCFQKVIRKKTTAGLDFETREARRFRTVGKSAAFVSEDSKSGHMLVVLERDGFSQVCSVWLPGGAAYLDGLPESGPMLILVRKEHFTHRKIVRLEDLPEKGAMITLTSKDRIPWRTVEVSDELGQPVSETWLQLDQLSNVDPVLSKLDTFTLPDGIHHGFWRPGDRAGEYRLAELPSLSATIHSLAGSAPIDSETERGTVQLQPHSSVMGRLTFRDPSWLQRLLSRSTLEYRLASNVARTRPLRSGEFCFPADTVGDGGRIFLVIGDQSFDLGPARVGVLTEREIPDSIFRACSYEVGP